MLDLSDFFNQMNLYWGMIAIPIVGLLASSHCLIMCAFAVITFRKSKIKSLSKNNVLFMALSIFVLIVMVSHHQKTMGKSQSNLPIFCLPFSKE